MVASSRSSPSATENTNHGKIDDAPFFFGSSFVVFAVVNNFVAVASTDIRWEDSNDSRDNREIRDGIVNGPVHVDSKASLKPKESVGPESGRLVLGEDISRGVHVQHFGMVRIKDDLRGTSFNGLNDDAIIVERIALGEGDGAEGKKKEQGVN